jgi:hypothetical protein
MQADLAPIIAELQRQAKVCETVAQDVAEEALTGASCDREQHTREARDWVLRSKVWLEAEAAVRALAVPATSIGCAAVLPSPALLPSALR